MSGKFTLPPSTEAGTVTGLSVSSGKLVLPKSADTASSETVEWKWVGVSASGVTVTVPLDAPPWLNCAYAFQQATPPEADEPVIVEGHTGGHSQDSL